MIEYPKGKIIKVISGGQVGSDQGGLAAAFDLQIETGGMAPKGYKTRWGSEPRLFKLGLTESDSEKYTSRTLWNVENSSGTVRFAYDFTSSGEIFTLKAIKRYKKPHFSIQLKDVEDGNFLIFDILDWFKKYDIKILNVAGNAGETKQQSTKIFSLVRKNLKLWIGKYNEEE